MKHERIGNQFKRITARAALALILIASGCDKDEDDTFTPIRIPDTAKRLGLSTGSEGVRNGVVPLPGMSFLVNVNDVPLINCGQKVDVIRFDEDVVIDTRKDVRVVSRDVAQVTCVYSDESFPITEFHGTPLPPSVIEEVPNRT